MENTMGYDRFETLSNKLTRGINFLVNDGSYMVAKSDAIVFMDRLIESGATILGVDGFSYDGVNLTPNMESIVDFGDNPEKAEIHRGVNAVISVDINFVEFTIE